MCCQRGALLGIKMVNYRVLLSKIVTSIFHPVLEIMTNGIQLKKGSDCAKLLFHQIKQQLRISPKRVWNLFDSPLPWALAGWALWPIALWYLGHFSIQSQKFSRIVFLFLHYVL